MGSSDRPRWMKEGLANRDRVRISSLDIKKSTQRSSPINLNSNEVDKYSLPLNLNIHLSDLWTMLRKVVLITVILTTISFVIPGFQDGKFLFEPYRPAILVILNSIIQHSISAISEVSDFQIFIGSPTTPLLLYINLAIFVSLLIALPLTLRELLKFVKPGLSVKEYQVLVKVGGYAILLFALGSLISYYVVVPVTLRILALTGGLIGNANLVQLYDLQAVMSLILWGTFSGGFLYASPMILVAAMYLDVLNPIQVEQRRREILFGIFLLAAIITPDPTMVSMLILSTPLVLVVEYVIVWGYRMELYKILETT